MARHFRSRQNMGNIQPVSTTHPTSQCRFLLMSNEPRSKHRMRRPWNNSIRLSQARTHRALLPQRARSGARKHVSSPQITRRLTTFASLYAHLSRSDVPLAGMSRRRVRHTLRRELNSRAWPLSPNLRAKISDRLRVTCDMLRMDGLWFESLNDRLRRSQLTSRFTTTD